MHRVSHPLAQNRSKGVHSDVYYFGPRKGIPVASGRTDQKLFRFLLIPQFRNAAETPHLPVIVAHLISNQDDVSKV